jgi:hypothetical protein
MSASPHQQRIILGSGSVARVLAQCFDALTIPDEWLKRRKWGALTPFAAPLVKCRHVFQVAVDMESSAQTQWRHDAFWRLYGALGGRSIDSAPGIKWLVLDCRNGGRGIDAPPSPYCHPVPAAGGLARIVDVCNEARPHLYTDWYDLQLADGQVAIRKEILRLVCNGGQNDENRSRILVLAKSLLPLQWERFCPMADHKLANLLRKWLRSPDTDSVTPWLVEGEALLRQTSLIP